VFPIVAVAAEAASRHGLILLEVAGVDDRAPAVVALRPGVRLRPVRSDWSRQLPLTPRWCSVPG